MAYRFDYPAEFVSLPDYTAHAGQTVEVIRPLRPSHRHKGIIAEGAGEYDFEWEAMFLIRAADGWEGHAYRSELARV